MAISMANVCGSMAPSGWRRAKPDRVSGDPGFERLICAIQVDGSRPHLKLKRQAWLGCRPYRLLNLQGLEGLAKLCGIRAGNVEFGKLRRDRRGIRRVCRILPVNEEGQEAAKPMPA